MALNYDFDMVSMQPASVPDAPPPSALPQHLQATVVALFRDPATVAAMVRAPQGVQAYLAASNFGINTYDSGAPAGRYPEADEALRIVVIETLAENVRRFDLPASDDTQPATDAFHLSAFFAAVAEAEPIMMERRQLPQQGQPAVSAPAAELQAADGHVSADTADEDQTTAALIAEAVASYGEKVDALIAGAVGTDATGADLSADATAPLPPPARRFRLPILPRWVTAGAALTVLGVAVGTAMI